MVPLDRARPVLLFNGRCCFCRAWVERWRRISGRYVQFVPFEDHAAEFPEIPAAEFQRAVQLVLPSGRLLSAAEAVFAALAFAPGYAWIYWLYRRAPGFAAASEWLYPFVSGHRDTLYKLVRPLASRSRHGDV